MGAHVCMCMRPTPLPARAAFSQGPVCVVRVQAWVGWAVAQCWARACTHTTRGRVTGAEKAVVVRVRARLPGGAPVRHGEVCQPRAPTCDISQVGRSLWACVAVAMWAATRPSPPPAPRVLGYRRFDLASAVNLDCLTARGSPLHSLSRCPHAPMLIACVRYVWLVCFAQYIDGQAVTLWLNKVRPSLNCLLSLNALLPVRSVVAHTCVYVCAPPVRACVCAARCPRAAAGGAVPQPPGDLLLLHAAVLPTGHAAEAAV
jgi:hypothetical protein